MRTFIIAAALALSAAALSAADKTVLGTAAAARVAAVDPLEGDRPVAACVAEHLPAVLPWTVVTTGGDLVLTIKARIGTKSSWFGEHGTVEIVATDSAGQKIWSAFRSGIDFDHGPLSPACQIADVALDLLRKEVKKARR